MARVRSFTSERMLQIENETIVNGEINEAGDLLLFRRDGLSINAGPVSGPKGDPGSGVTGVEIFYQAGESGTEEPTGEWKKTIPMVPDGHYLWVKTVTTYTDPNDPEKTFDTVTFTVTKNALPGEDGRGIKKTETLYQMGNSGTVPPTGEWLPSIPTVISGRYLWSRTVITYTDDTTSTSYAVAKQGADGTPGNDGDSSYLHVAYAKSADGSEGFSTTDPTGASYLGTYTDHTQADSQDYRDYKWSMIRGAAGNGVSSSTVSYQAGTDGVNAPTGTWTSSIPEVPEGLYLWSRTIINFTDGGSQTIFSVSKQGAKGEAGSDGRGIVSITEEYYLSESATSLVGGSWSETRPTWQEGKYYWTRSVIEYTTGLPTTTTPICVSGSSGTSGRSVIDVDVLYYQSNSPTELIGGTWVTEAPSWVEGKYIWTRTMTTYSEGEPTITDPVSITGSKGADGKDGKDGDDGDDGVSVSSVTIFYFMGEDKPDKPTTLVPSQEWSDLEPSYVEGSDDDLYIVIRTILSDSSFEYSSVSLDSRYQAAKAAYEKALSVDDKAMLAAKRAADADRKASNASLGKLLTKEPLISSEDLYNDNWHTSVLPATNGGRYYWESEEIYGFYTGLELDSSGNSQMIEEKSILTSKGAIYLPPGETVAVYVEAASVGAYLEIGIASFASYNNDTFYESKVYDLRQSGEYLGLQKDKLVLKYTNTDTEQYAIIAVKAYSQTTGGNSYTGIQYMSIVNYTEIEEAQKAAEEAKFLAEGIYNVIPSTTEPTERPNGLALEQGDQWWVEGAPGTDVAGKFIGVQVYDGTQWVPRQLVADSVLVPGSVGPVLIEDGAITGPKISAEAIESKHLKSNIIESEHIQAESIDGEKLSFDAIDGKIINGVEIFGSKFTQSGLGHPTGEYTHHVTSDLKDWMSLGLGTVSYLKQADGSETATVTRSPAGMCALGFRIPNQYVGSTITLRILVTRSGSGGIFMDSSLRPAVTHNVNGGQWYELITSGFVATGGQTAIIGFPNTTMGQVYEPIITVHEQGSISATLDNDSDFGPSLVWRAGEEVTGLLRSDSFMLRMLGVETPAEHTASIDTTGIRMNVTENGDPKGQSKVISTNTNLSILSDANTFIRPSDKGAVVLGVDGASIQIDGNAKRFDVNTGNNPIYRSGRALPKAWVSGSLSIKGGSNTPSSATVTFPAGYFTTSPFVTATAQTTVPGSTVRGTSVSSRSAGSVIVWVYRTNATATTVLVEATEY